MNDTKDLNELARKARAGDLEARADLQSQLRPHLDRLLRRADRGGAGHLADKLRQAALRVQAVGATPTTGGTAGQLARLLADRVAPHLTVRAVPDTWPA